MSPEPKPEVREVRIGVQLTPNPDSLKFILNFKLFDFGAVYFDCERVSAGSELPTRLFRVPAVTSVLIGSDFVTVSKRPDVSWEPFVPEIFTVMKAVLESGQSVIRDELIPQSPGAEADPVIANIRTILEQEIRPALARDGGDVVFLSYQNGVVRIHLTGACRSCPSSSMTIKFGIEGRLKQAIDGIKEVESV